LQKLMEKLNLDSYQVAWIAFLKGVLISLVIYLIFFKNSLDVSKKIQ
jgi:hypothetical protein